MPSLSPATGLTITNPLVLYRALLATKKIEPDASQHRLAIHLQKLYLRLKDYTPEVDYSYRLDQLNRISRDSLSSTSTEAEVGQDVTHNAKPDSLFSSFRAHKQQKDVLALTKKLTDHESAMKLQSPQGLLIYGEVGTGKSMLVDLLANCLPNQKKRRWHFNTFMLETFARLEQLRQKRLNLVASRSLGINQDDEHSLLWLARDMISTSPILFLDEFQLPDRAASKILSSLFTSFFHLGGVLIATSNRMPEELANASGIEFVAPPLSRIGLFGKRWGLVGLSRRSGRGENLFSRKSDFAAFLEVLRARCEVWDMEGGKDWRRREAEEIEAELTVTAGYHYQVLDNDAGLQGLKPMILENSALRDEENDHLKLTEEAKSFPTKEKTLLPKYYHLNPSPLDSGDAAKAVDKNWDTVLLQSVSATSNQLTTAPVIPWESASLRVYGRNLIVPRHRSGITMWTFQELCTTNLGPADYISLASTFHTFVLTDVPILKLLHKNEARRLITLLDALYEARCKLLIRAEAGPDSIFFPETELQHPTTSKQTSSHDLNIPDQIHPETFSEIYQDQTSPFRPNISPYTSSTSPPSYTSPDLQNTSPFNRTGRSVLADEDSDFGPVYSAGRSHSSPSPGLHRGSSDGAPGAGNEIGRHEGPNFARTGTFTGEDEKFAYKRARSRLWEMCGARWWNRQEEGWWNPVPQDVRRWEGSIANNQTLNAANTLSKPEARPIETQIPSQEEALFPHGASPFRVSKDAPPKIAWTHAWGMMKWGRKAGVWGRGVEGLQDRKGAGVGDGDGGKKGEGE